MKPDPKFVALFCLAASIAATALAQSGGADIYKAKCQICHGADGLGANSVGKALNIVSFKDPFVVKSSNAELVTIVKNGKKKMPPFAGKLDDAQINAVVEYIRTLEK